MTLENHYKYRDGRWRHHHTVVTRCEPVLDFSYNSMMMEEFPTEIERIRVFEHDGFELRII